MPIVDFTNPASVARFRQFLEDTFWIKYLRYEPRPFVPPIPDPRQFYNPEPQPSFGDPTPQPNYRDLLTSELLLNNLKYTQFDKGDNSLLSQLKKTDLTKEVLTAMHSELKEAMHLIEKDISLLKGTVHK